MQGRGAVLCKIYGVRAWQARDEDALRVGTREGEGRNRGGDTISRARGAGDKRGGGAGDKRGGGAGLASPRRGRFAGGDEGGRARTGRERGGPFFFWGGGGGIRRKGLYERRMRASPWKAHISRAITLRLWKIA